MHSPPTLARVTPLRLLVFLGFWLWLGMGVAGAQSVFINELHYDNTGGDADEGVEIAGPAGTDLGDYQLYFYSTATSASSALVTTTPPSPHALSGSIPNLSNGFGVVWFPVAGIQNGSNDALALYKISTQQVVQFLSYEGPVIAAVGSGPASGMSAVDIAVAEGTNSPVGHSLQLKGTGSLYANFTWDPAKAHTRGAINTGQTFSGPAYALSFTINTATIAEDAGAVAATGTISVSPAPVGSLTVSLLSSDVTEATVPASVVIGPSGTATFSIAAVTDGIADEDQVINITAYDGASIYPAKSVSLTVHDINAQPPVVFDGVLRVACFNVLFGVNTPGSPEYLAAKDQLQRINPHVIGFSEVDAANDFADVKTLLSELGFSVTNTYFATAGDGFSSFVSGDFSNLNQCVCIASKFPIVQRVQINRGVAGRVEMSRYPLFVAVDIPGVPAADDPAFVAVHLKANSGISSATDADRFRRVVESYRISQFLQTNGWDGDSKNLFLLGDFNDNDGATQALEYFTGINTAAPGFADGSTLPVSFQLGADIAGANGITLPYTTVAPGGTVSFPHVSYGGLHVTAPEIRHADKTTRLTYNKSTFTRFDYIFARNSIVNAGLFAGEVYNSRIEPAFDGLPKIDVPAAGSLPVGNGSVVA